MLTKKKKYREKNKINLEVYEETVFARALRSHGIRGNGRSSTAYDCVIVSVTSDV